MIKGFKNFLMRGELIVIAVGLVVALAFSTLIASFTGNIITPLINSLAGNSTKRPGSRLDDQRSVHRAWAPSSRASSTSSSSCRSSTSCSWCRIARTWRARAPWSSAPPTPAPPVKTCPECLSTDLPASGHQVLALLQRDQLGAHPRTCNDPTTRRRGTRSTSASRMQPYKASRKFSTRASMISSCNAGGRS